MNMTHFNGRRTITYVSSVEVSNGFQTVPVSARGLGDSLSSQYVSGVRTFVNTFPAARLLSVNVQFDQRGAASTAAQPRVSAFLLPGATSTWDVDKLPAVASFAGAARQQIVGRRSFRLRLGPEFVSGVLTASTGSTSSDTLVLSTQGFQGTARCIWTVQLVGPPTDLVAAPAEVNVYDIEHSDVELDSKQKRKAEVQAMSFIDSVSARLLKDAEEAEKPIINKLIKELETFRFMPLTVSEKNTNEYIGDLLARAESKGLTSSSAEGRLGLTRLGVPVDE